MGPVVVGLLALGGYLLYKHSKDTQSSSQAAINAQVANPDATTMMANALAPSNVDVGALEQIAQWFDQKGLTRYASIVRLKKQYLLASKPIDPSAFMAMVTNPTVPVQ